MSTDLLITAFFNDRPDLLEHVVYLPQEGYDEPQPMLPREHAKVLLTGCTRRDITTGRHARSGWILLITYRRNTDEHVLW